MASLSLEQTRQRFPWLDYARGYLIFMMFITHSTKGFSGEYITRLARENISDYFLNFTLGFVGITGVGLTVLQERIVAKHRLWNYCAQRGLRLYLVALAIAIFAHYHQRHINIDGTLSEFIASLIPFFIVSTSWDLERFLAMIAIFVIFAPSVLPRNNELPWRAIAGVFILSILAVLSMRFSELLPTGLKFVLTTAPNYLIAGSLGVMVGYHVKQRHFSLNWQKWQLFAAFILCIFAVSILPKVGVPFSTASLILDTFFRIVSVLAFAFFLQKISGAGLLKQFLSLLGGFALMTYEVHWVAGSLFKSFSDSHDWESFFAGHNAISTFMLAFGFISIIVAFVSLWSLLIIKIRIGLPLLNKALRDELGI